MRLIPLGILAVALLATLLWWGKRPRIYRDVPLAGLPRFISSLLAQMEAGGFFVAERQRGAGFLQVALRSASTDSYTVEFGLPEIDWSASRFGTVEAALARHQFDVKVERGTGEVSRFMRVPITGRSEEVIGRVMALFEVVAAALGWEPSSTFTVRFGGPLDIPRIRARLAVAKERGA